MYSNNGKLKDAGVETKQQQRNETYTYHSYCCFRGFVLLVALLRTHDNRTEENRLRASSSSTRSITGLKNNNNTTSLDTGR